MPIDGYTTTIEPERTAEQIAKKLRQHGVTSVVTLYEPSVGGLSIAVGMVFTLPTRWGVREFKLPIRAEGVLETLKRDKVAKGHQTIHQARRVAWRIALKWIEAQLALIDATGADVAEVFFPYIVARWDQPTGQALTAYQVYAADQKEITQ